jgi:hypothetical protein
VAGVAHGELVAQGANVDVGQPSFAALVAELVAALTNPGGGLGELGR